MLSCFAEEISRYILNTKMDKKSNLRILEAQITPFQMGHRGLFNK